MSSFKKRLLAAVVKLVIMVLVFNFPLIGSTNSYFSDQEASAGNRISAGDWTAPLVKIETPGDGATVSGSVGIYGTITDNAPHHYWLVVENSDGVVVSGPGVVGETNSFTNRLLYTWNTAANPDGSYIIKLEARDSYGNKDAGSVSWTNVTVNNTPVPSPSLTPTPTTIPSTGLVINEVYYNTMTGTEDEGIDEWVELYNNSDSAINIKDWKLLDNNGTTTIHPNVSVPGKGFAVLAKSASTFTKWSIPNSAVKVELGKKIGNGLANDSDRLVLQNSASETVDAVSWGTDTSAFDPSVAAVTDGHSISRKEAGVDTDTAADWMDTYSGSSPTGPNPGTNPHTGPALTLTISPDLKSVSFKVENIEEFINISYELTYDTDTISDGVVGSEDLSGQEEYTKEGITLGTCSSGGTCVYYTGVYNIKLKVILEDSDGNPTALEKII